MSSVKEQLETLVALQRSETEIRRIEQELKGIDGRIASLNSEVMAYEQRVADCQIALDELRKQYRSDENEIKLIDTQISKSKEKLRAVKTNKEYQSILKEIDDMKQKSSTIEDQMLTMLDGMEKAESDVAEQKSDFADVKRETAAKEEEIRRIAEQQQGILTQL